MGISQIWKIVKFIISYWPVMKELYVALMGIIQDKPDASPEKAKCALDSVLDACKPSTITTPDGTKVVPIKRRGGLFGRLRRRK